MAKTRGELTKTDWKVVYDGDSRPIIQTKAIGPGKFLALGVLIDRVAEHPYVNEADDVQDIVIAMNCHKPLIDALKMIQIMVPIGSEPLQVVNDALTTVLAEARKARQ